MKRLYSMILITSLALTTCSNHANEVVHDNIQTEYQTIRLVSIPDGLEHPWSFCFLPNGGILVTERPGRLYLIRNGQKTEIHGLPNISGTGQGGLLDIALHPEFQKNQLVYFTYSKPKQTQTATALARARLQGDRLIDTEDIFVQNRYSSPGRHYGSRIAFTPDNKIIMSIGDRGTEPERAQDLTDHAGSIVRLNHDGSVPDDNPFLDRDDAAPEIYAYGLRNVQGLTIHPDTKDIWATVHGPRGGDQLNIILPGRNYGWPEVTTGRDYRTQQPFGQARTREDIQEPIIDWHITIAPSGLTVITGDRYPQWKGNLLAGGLASQQIRRIVMENQTPVHQEAILHKTIGRVRDIRMSPDNYIYIITDQQNAALYRLEPR